MKNGNKIVAYAEWLVKYRWWVMLVSLLALVALGSGMRHLAFTNDYRAFFSKDNPQLQAFEELQNVYSKNDNVLFVLAPKDGKVFTRETLATVEWLTKEAWQLPYSSRVDSVSNFQYTRANGDDLVVTDLVKDTKTFSDSDLEQVKQIALDEPLLRNRLISPQAHVTGVNATIILPGKKLDEVPEVVAYARKLVDQVKARDPNIEVYLTGIVMMNNAFPEAAFKDMGTLVPGMYLLVFIILFLLLRSITGTLATLAVTFMSIIIAMGIAGSMGIKLTPPSASAHIIILTLSIADCVHLLVTMFHEMRHGTEKRKAIVESLRVNMQPIFLTSLTTVVGFLSMNFSDVPPFHDLGNIVAIGVATAFIYSVFFFPAVMTVLPVHVKPARANGAAMNHLAQFVISKRRPLFFGMTAVIVLMVAFIPRNELNDQFVEYFDESVAFRTHTDFAVANLTGIYTVQYSLGAGEADGINNPSYQHKIEEFANWYRQQPGVIHVNTLSDIMKRLNKNMHADELAWYRLPDNRQLTAQYLLLYEMSLPFGLDLNNQINVDKSATRFTVTMENMTTKQVLATERRAQDWLREHAPEAMFAHGASPTVMFSYIGARNIRSMLLGSSIALVVISLILIVALRSLKIGLVSLVPNLAPAGMAFGLWGILVGEIGLSLSIVVAMTLGIVVDDTIHFLSKYLRARREKNLPAEDAVRYAFSTVGTALWVTTLILVAGFSVLVFSAFKLNSGMGLLTAITIAIALITDFLFLPPLLLKLEGKKHEPVAVADTADTPAS